MKKETTKALTIGLLLAGLAFGANDWRDAKVTAVTYEITPVGKGVCYTIQDGADEYTGCQVNKVKFNGYREEFAAVGDVVSYRLQHKTMRPPMYIRPKGGQEHGVFIQRTNKRPDPR